MTEVLSNTTPRRQTPQTPRLSPSATAAARETRIFYACHQRSDKAGRQTGRNGEIMARTWGVGILGLGHWYSAYGLARALPEYPKAELVAAAEPDRRRLDAYCGTFGIEGVT